MSWYEYGTNHDLEVMVSKSVMDQVTPNYVACLILVIVLGLLLLIPYLKTKNRLYLCYIIAPILAMVFVQGLHIRYYRKVAKGLVHYNFITIEEDGSVYDSQGHTVSPNYIGLTPGNTYIITDTSLAPTKLTEEETELYRYILLSE